METGCTGKFGMLDGLLSLVKENLSPKSSSSRKVGCLEKIYLLGRTAIPCGELITQKNCLFEFTQESSPPRKVCRPGKFVVQESSAPRKVGCP